MEDYMFKVGDNAVYPAHGVGVIKRIEEKMISGKKKSFYVLQVIENGMTIMVPTDNTAGVGLRALVSKEEVDEVIEIGQLGIEHFNPQKLAHFIHFQKHIFVRYVFNKIKTAKY